MLFDVLKYINVLEGMTASVSKTVYFNAGRDARNAANFSLSIMLLFFNLINYNANVNQLVWIPKNVDIIFCVLSVSRYLS